MMAFWKSAKQELLKGNKVILMYVLESMGSSPGRQGFKMLVSESGNLAGSIGGGIMEQKLVELCKNNLLSKKDFKPFIKKQIHQDSISADKSGLICSGQQTIAFYQLAKPDISLVSELLNSIVDGCNGILTSNQLGLSFNYNLSSTQKFELEISNDEKWILKEDIGNKPELHIIGGGHVGLALSKFGHELGFRVKIYDDREGLNTIDQNKYGRCILLSNYSKINDYITYGDNNYVALMSFGYKTDKIILKQLLSNDFKYLGMMGSKTKVNRLFKELAKEGASPSQLKKVHSPIGIAISSKTPEEIAVSILAEIIQIKNS